MSKQHAEFKDCTGRSCLVAEGSVPIFVIGTPPYAMELTLQGLVELHNIIKKILEEKKNGI